MISESLDFAKITMVYYTCIKENNLTWIEKQLDKIGAKIMRIIAMETGNKTRVIAWTFL
ncbi:MAG: RlmF-related methyltransferase [Saprospiraceae bacterium]